MRPHEKLDVWQQSMVLSERVYKLSGKYPREEVYGLVSQMRRAGVSVCCNIAEGAARQTKTEFKQYLYMARGSLSELETQIAISLRLGFLEAQETGELFALSERIGQMITGLIRKLK